MTNTIDATNSTDYEAPDVVDHGSISQHTFHHITTSGSFTCGNKDVHQTDFFNNRGGFFFG